MICYCSVFKVKVNNNLKKRTLELTINPNNKPKLSFFLASGGCGELVNFDELQLTAVKTEVQMTFRKFATNTFSLLVYMLESSSGHLIDCVYDA